MVTLSFRKKKLYLLLVTIISLWFLWCQTLTSSVRLKSERWREKDEGWLVKIEGLRVLDQKFPKTYIYKISNQTEINFGWIYNLKWRDILSTDLNKIGEEEKYLQVYTFFYLYSTSFPVQNYHLEFKCFNHLWSTIYNENKGQIYNLQSSVSGYN
jgi:hypothetical protein